MRPSKICRLSLAYLAINGVATVQNQSYFLVSHEFVIHAKPKGDHARNDFKGKLQHMAERFSNHVVPFFVVPHQVVDSKLDGGHDKGDERGDPRLAVGAVVFWSVGGKR